MPIACEKKIVFARGIINTRNYEKIHEGQREAVREIRWNRNTDGFTWTEIGKNFDKHLRENRKAIWHTNANSRKVSAPSFSTSKMENMRVLSSDSGFHSSTGNRSSSQNTRAERRPCE
jgi:S-adenosylmethionine synthetase